MKGRVLVTGGTGFIGRWAVESLRGRRYEVHLCARRARSSIQSGVTLHEVDLLAESAAARIAELVRPTSLLHLAWQATPGTYWTSARNLDWVAATLRLARAAVENGCQRIVGAGTCAEYDWTDGGLLEERASRIAPASLYGTCKAATSQVLQAYAALTNLSFAWARIFYQYGPHEHPGRLVPSVMRAVLANQEARCSSGDQIRDLLCSPDVGDALAAVLDSNVQGPVNIGSGTPVQIREVIERAATLAGNGGLVKLGELPNRPGEPDVLLPTVGRLQNEVGWAPRLSLDEGLRQTVEYWRTELASGRGLAS